MATTTAREISRKNRTQDRRAARTAKFAAVALDWHGYTIAEYETSTWCECVDESHRLLETNSLVSVVDMWEL